VGCDVPCLSRTLAHLAMHWHTVGMLGLAVAYEGGRGRSSALTCVDGCSSPFCSGPGSARRHNSQALEICSAVEDVLCHGLRPVGLVVNPPEFPRLWDVLLTITHADTVQVSTKCCSPSEPGFDVVGIVRRGVPGHGVSHSDPLPLPRSHPRVCIRVAQNLEELPFETVDAKCRAWIRVALNEGLCSNYIRSMIDSSHSALLSTHYGVRCLPVHPEALPHAPQP
jgi:hypothetical protein